MLSLRKHIRQTLRPSQRHSTRIVLDSLRSFLTSRIEQARTDPEQVRWLAHPSTWTPKKWDAWRDYQEREEGRATSERIEHDAATEKAQHQTANVSATMARLFAEKDEDGKQLSNAE